jgi:hypothetical protein
MIENLFLPVTPSFLLHVGHVHRLRFFLSTLDAVNGDIESAPIIKKLKACSIKNQKNAT